MQIKKCADCKEDKPLSDYHKANGKRLGVAGRCKECQSAYHKQWYAKNRERKLKDWRRINLALKYGITEREWDEILAAQGGGCAICGVSAGYIRSDRGGVKRLSVDHDHQTGAVRGLLCDACNTGLGKFRDDPGLLARAISYLG